ncbi:MAG TPA: PQQ-dependent sugar dehydrogenase [Fimbriimonadaceae bacterium]|nr:PQQ-dependent sugar dehydrogenase [Fimbriimonadaceae bacterium]
MSRTIFISVGLMLAGVATAQLSSQLVASGLSRPVSTAFPPDETNRIFIVEQRVGATTDGRIRIVKNGVLLATPFITISGIGIGGEQGVLGITFHPNYATNGFFYVNFVNSAGTTVIRRYTASPPTADTASTTTGFDIALISQPYENHNGGTIHFGADGYLYIGNGDGGSGNDPQNRAQSLTSELGKFLRVDVNSDGFPGDSTRNYAIPPANPFVGGSTVDDAIWSYGWRNPWKWSFDPVRNNGFGGMVVMDVGQDTMEEVNYEPPATPGLNYGWRVFEGTFNTGLGGGTPPFVAPIAEYPHPEGCSISGGLIYRGVRLGTAFYGRAVYSDFCGAFVRSVGLNFNPDGTATPGTIIDHGFSLGTQVAAVDADPNGEILYVLRNGSVRRLTDLTNRYGISGQVVFSNLDPGAPRPSSATFEFRNVGSTTPLYSLTVGLDATGQFRLPAPTGAFDIAVKRTHWLRRKVTSSTGPNDATGVILTLVNGDVNGDNVVDSDDFDDLVANFGGSGPTADLDENGSVDSDDFDILVGAFGQSGDQ